MMRLHKIISLGFATCSLACCERSGHDSDAQQAASTLSSKENEYAPRLTSRSSTTDRLKNCRGGLMLNGATSAVLSEIYSLAKTVNMDEFNELWSFLNEIPNDDGTQDSLRAEAIKRLVVITSLENCISFISTQFGHGNLRNQLMEHAFGAAKNKPNELLALMDGLPTGPERDAARLALEFRATKDGYFSLEDFFDVKELSNGSFDVLRGSILHEFISMRDPLSQIDYRARTKEILFTISSLNSRKAISDEQTKRLIQTVSENQPFALWEEIQSGSDGVITQLCTPMLSTIVKNMATNSPGKSLDLLNQTSNIPATMYAVVLNVWLGRDAEAAFKWIDTNVDTLPPLAGDPIDSSIVQYSLGKRDIAQAKEYLQKIDDPELKKKAEGWIWGAERDSLRREVSKDPAGTIQAIVSGQSNYGVYWLEEAMDTWVAKDFEKAQGWYQQNWSSLPAGKAQFLAAAFARQAAGQGDTATARQWASHIQDPKTKQRIDEGIAKAEARK